MASELSLSGLKEIKMSYFAKHITEKQLPQLYKK